MFKKIKHWYFRRKVIQTIDMIKTLDPLMIKAGYDRVTRRRFWRAMHKDRKEVIEVLNNIAKTLGPS